ncbi:hypothetical protein [Bradyrhizobium sp. P5_C11_2]
MLPTWHTRSLPTVLKTFGSLGLMVFIMSSTAQAQSVNSRIDQPTPGTLPSGIDTTKRAGLSAHDPTENVAPPAAISSSVNVMEGGNKGADTGRPKKDRVDPLKHLPPEDRR